MNDISIQTKSIKIPKNEFHNNLYLLLKQFFRRSQVVKVGERGNMRKKKRYTSVNTLILISMPSNLKH